jgi:hypothetical protein
MQTLKDELLAQVDQIGLPAAISGQHRPGGHGFGCLITEASQKKPFIDWVVGFDVVPDTLAVTKMSRHISNK